MELVHGHNFIQMDTANAKTMFEDEEEDSGVGSCRTWCIKNNKPWLVKCRRKMCRGCAQCAQPGKCHPRCAKIKLTWENRCRRTICKGCAECSSTTRKPATNVQFNIFLN